MKKTQAAMQAKIDKLNANMAVGLDKHIDGTVNKIVNAYHLKEKRLSQMQQQTDLTNGQLAARTRLPRKT